jgi:RimJ/RimL family protein N-acetyltransferase
MGELSNNAVDPAHQNRGIATAMYGWCLDRMRAADMHFVKVSTGLDVAHAPARRAYEKAGFAPGFEGVDYFRLL